MVICCVGAQNRYMKNIMKIQSKGISGSHVRIFNVSECVVRKEMQCNTSLIESCKILLTILYVNAIKATHAIFICKNSFFQLHSFIQRHNDGNLSVTAAWIQTNLAQRQSIS